VTPLYASEKAGYSVLSLSVFSGLSLVLVSILLFHFKYKYVYPSSQQRSSLSSEHNSSSLETKTDLVVEKLRRKNAFLDLNKGYGYASSRRGHIDTWREHEFPGLISPISESTIRDGHCQTNDAERSDGIENDEKEVYLDYAGASLPSKSQLNALHLLSMKSQVLGNPHSIGPAASRTMSQIEHVKRRILELFDADVGSIHGHGIKTEEQYSTTEESKEQHPGYDIIFTSGATEALKIVAENFAWSSNSVFLYSKNVHTSVIGMRGPAMTHGATFQCKSQSEITNARSESFSSWAQNTFDLKEESKNSHSEKEKVNHLLAIPLESNFEGDRLNAQHIIKEARNSSRTIMSRQNQWYTLLDVAKAASTSPISLRELDPDYACLSFYKIFGAPTGIGCLFVKRNKCNTLLHPNNHSYFGGGSVDVVLTGQKFVFPRSSPSPLSSLVHGTINFRNIINLLPGLEEIGDLGGMRQVRRK
jgi:molybdenum cofactor sulfurtransferase